MVFVIAFYFSCVLWSCFGECSWYHTPLNSGYIQSGLGSYNTLECILLSEKTRYSFIMTNKSLLGELPLDTPTVRVTFSGSYASQCSYVCCPAEVSDTESHPEKWRIWVSVWWQRCDYKIHSINSFSSCSTHILSFYLTLHSRLSSFMCNFFSI